MNTSHGTIRVAIAEDQQLITKMLTGLVDAQDGMQMVGEAFNGKEIVSLCRTLVPDVVLMDLNMPIMDGAAATREIRAMETGTAVLILTAHEDDALVFEGIRAGALGYLLKSCTPEELAGAIRTVHAGETIVSPGIAREALAAFEGKDEIEDEATMLSLTERELEIVGSLAQGKSNKEIARALYISDNTVRNHIANIYKKLHINDRTQAVLYAIRNGLVNLEEIEND